MYNSPLISAIPLAFQDAKMPNGPFLSEIFSVPFTEKVFGAQN